MEMCKWDINYIIILYYHALTHNYNISYLHLFMLNHFFCLTEFLLQRRQENFTSPEGWRFLLSSNGTRSVIFAVVMPGNF